MSKDHLTALLKNIPKEYIQSAEVMYTATPQYHVRDATNPILSSNFSETPQLQELVNTEYVQYSYTKYFSVVAQKISKANLLTIYQTLFTIVPSQIPLL